MTTIHLPSATILALDPEYGAYIFRIEDDYLIMSNPEIGYEGHTPLPSASLKILGRRDEISEEVARGIVERLDSGYIDYILFRGHLQNYCETALESLNSLLSSYGIEGNPLLLIDTK